MNTAYGKPEAESLPFDLRHLRWPITYLSDLDAKDEFPKLVEKLVKAIGLILSNHVAPSTVVESFVPRKTTKSPAAFWEDAADILGDRSHTVTVPDGAKAYLRLYPSVAHAPISTELEAKKLAVQGQLEPLCCARRMGLNWDRNIFGAIGSRPEENGKLYHFTQLFLSCELWGVDALVLNADHIRQQLEHWGRGSNTYKYIAYDAIERGFSNALQNYLEFAQTRLRIFPPFQIEAGVVGIKGYSLATNSLESGGNALRDTIHWQCEISSLGRPAWEMLADFFERIWGNCGIQRPAERQAELARQFGGLWRRRQNRS